MFFKRKVSTNDAVPRATTENAPPTGANRRVFLSYSRRDREVVDWFYNDLTARDLSVFMDVASIMPGEDWSSRLAAIIGEASAIVVFVSRAALESQIIQFELQQAAAKSVAILPVFLERIAGDMIPAPLRERHFLVLDEQSLESLKRMSAAIVETLERIWAETQGAPALAPAASEQAAESLAAELRSESQPAAASNSVFVVHGHDTQCLQEVEKFLESIGVKAVVLTRMSGDDQSLFQRFFRFGSEANFAIVIITGDDFGASLIQYEAEGVKDRALQFRARQNVVLELGFFYGRLGWENVFVLSKAPNKVYPNFERPSDLDGVVFHSMSPGAEWQERLRERLGRAKIIARA